MASLPSEQGRDPPELLERCDRGYVQGLWELNRGLPGARIEVWSEATAMACSIPSEPGNTLFVIRAPKDAEDLLDRARRFFSGPNPWRVVGNGESRGPLGEAIEDSMNEKKGDPGMLLHPMTPAPHAPSSLRIERVSEEKQLSDFVKASSKSFRTPEFVMRGLYRGPPSEDDAHVIHVGYEGREPVASAVTTVFEGIAGIFSVGVREEFRRRGYGAAITWAAVEAGRERGADAAYLQASAMGRPLYEGMGFRAVTEYFEWHKRVTWVGRWRTVAYFLWKGVRGW